MIQAVGEAWLDGRVGVPPGMRLTVIQLDEGSALADILGRDLSQLFDEIPDPAEKLAEALREVTGRHVCRDDFEMHMDAARDALAAYDAARKP